MFGISSLRTNSCCCGISLRTGTITILVLNSIVGSFMALNYHKASRYGTGFSMGHVIFIVIEIAALYGTLKKKPDFIIPHLVVTAISLMIFLLAIVACLIFLPFAYKVLSEMTYLTPDGKTEHMSKSTSASFYILYALVIVSMIINEAIGLHFFKVVLSHYYELKTMLLLNINPPPPPIGFVA